MAQLLQIQAQIQTSGLHHDKFLTSEMLRFSAGSPAGDLHHAHHLFDHSPTPMLSSWNHLIRGYSQRNSSQNAISVFLEMRQRGMRPNELTFPFVFKSCAELSALKLGRQVHADVLKSGFDSVVYVQNTLMHLYGSCCKVRDVKKVFDGMSLRTVVSWNTILSACVDNSLPEESIHFFAEMTSSGFEPDQTTFVVLLSASAETGSLRYGRWVHSHIVCKGLEINHQLGTALVNMYAKCGAIACAVMVFDRMSVRNVWTWSAMILGFAQHGLAKKAVRLFFQMRNSSIEPNYVTFLGVLCACSHAGLVSEGKQFFHEMVHKHGIEPMMTHYSALVDILGRKGLLDDAYQFVERMPVEPDAVVWRTLLSACQIHSSKDGNGVGEMVRRRLLSLEPRRSGNYVIAANMYSEAGSWEEASKMRRTMREEGLKKMVAESCIDVGGSVHRFVSGDESCADCEKIYQLLDKLNLNMKMICPEDLNFIISE
ncbi:putative tetratricopeptide-like helical domain superfamily [Dioscorea sansibarensis]